MLDTEIKSLVETLRTRTAFWECKRETFIVRSEREFVIKVKPVLPETHIRISCPDPHGMKGAKIEIQGYRWGTNDQWELVTRSYDPLKTGYRLGVTYQFWHRRVPAREKRKIRPIKVIIRGAPLGSRVFVSTH